MSCVTIRQPLHGKEGTTTKLRPNGLTSNHKQVSSPNLTDFFNPFHHTTNGLQRVKVKEPEFIQNRSESNFESVHIPYKQGTLYSKLIPHIEYQISGETVDSIRKMMTLTYEAHNFLKKKFDAVEEGILGSGSSGIVYFAKSNTLSLNGSCIDLAIKRFFPKESYESDSDYIQKHSYEIYLSCSLEHPNIVKTYKAYLQDGCLNLVMEKVANQYFDLITTTDLPITTLNHYFYQVVQGVHHLHSKGVIHRDLKLDNILVTDDGTIKLVDLGFATVIRSHTEIYTRLTTGVVGSDPYMAPELFEFPFEAYDGEKCDIWSLGIIYLASVSKRFPWDRASPEDPLYAKYLVDPATLTEFIADTDALGLILHMLHPDPKLRASMDQILRNPWFLELETSLFNNRWQNANSKSNRPTSFYLI